MNKLISDLSLMGELSPRRCADQNHITATSQSQQPISQATQPTKSPHSDEPELQPSTYDLHRPKEPINNS